MPQVIFKGIENLYYLLKEKKTPQFLLVCDSSFPFLTVKDRITNIGIPHITFNDFSSNPLHSDARKGLKILIDNKIKTIVAIGGGSSIDVAKCIKLDSNMEDIEIIAIPTTAGTGSESTKFIVVYEDNKKQSLGKDSVIPDYVIIEPAVLKTLPLYQKKCTIMDALCQSIESYWSINANDVSKSISLKAMKKIKDNMDKYILENDESIYRDILEAANLSGQAINITQTTAPHAMSYKITSLYNFPHGHAVAVCLPYVWDKMLNYKKMNDIFDSISKVLGYDNPAETINWFKNKLYEYELYYPVSDRYEEDINILTESVNQIRLKNNPVQFNKKELEELYREIIRHES